MDSMNYVDGRTREEMYHFERAYVDEGTNIGSNERNDELSKETNMWYSYTVTNYNGVIVGNTIFNNVDVSRLRDEPFIEILGQPKSEDGTFIFYDGQIGFDFSENIIKLRH